MRYKAMDPAKAKPFILSLLETGECHFDQIRKSALDVSEGRDAWSPAGLLRLIFKMEKEGLIRSRWKSDDQGRMRKYYSGVESPRRIMDGTEKPDPAADFRPDERTLNKS